jgi:hypothetical protein
MPPTAVLRELSPASLVGWGETETSLTTPFGGEIWPGRGRREIILLAAVRTRWRSSAGAAITRADAPDHCHA